LQDGSPSSGNRAEDFIETFASVMPLIEALASEGGGPFPDMQR